MNNIKIPFPICDVHTHLYDDKYSADLDQVIARALENNVHKIILCNEHDSTVEALLKAIKTNPQVLKGCLGIHPCCIESDEQVNNMIQKIKLEFSQDSSNQIVAIGEVGLDFTPKILQDQLTRAKQCATIDELKELQRNSLIKFIDLANELALPLNVHSRSAGRPVVDLFLEKPAKYGVLLHCFDGAEKVVKKVVQKDGFYFSVPCKCEFAYFV